MRDQLKQRWRQKQWHMQPLLGVTKCCYNPPLQPNKYVPSTTFFSGWEPGPFIADGTARLRHLVGPEETTGTRGFDRSIMHNRLKGHDRVRKKTVGLFSPIFSPQTLRGTLARLMPANTTTYQSASILRSQKMFYKPLCGIGVLSDGSTI